MVAMTAQELLTHLVGIGMTQTQIAKESGVPQPVISRLIGGKQNDLSYKDGKKIERVFFDHTKKVA